MPEPEAEGPNPPSPSKDTKKVSSSISNTSAVTATTSNTSSRDTDAETSLLRLTRRHSLPASYHLSSFLSLFNTGSSSERAPITSNVDESQSNPQQAQPQIDVNTRHSRSATVSSPTGQPASATSVNRHRYGHQHNRSVVLDQPVVVRTYNPPATPGFPTRAGMMNPAIFEEREVQRIELPPIEAFSFDGILRAVNPEVTRTLDKISFLCLRLKQDVKAEIEVAVQTQREIQSQKQQVEKLTAHALKTTSARSESLTASSSGLKGGVAIEDLAQLTETTYTTLGSIVSTLLAIDELLPPQERLAPDYSAHQTHYPRVHHLLNKKHREITARFGGGGETVGRSMEETRLVPSMLDQDTDNISPLESPNLLPISFPNPIHQEPGWLRRRMSSSSTMLLSLDTVASSQGSSSASKRLSLPPNLQLKTVLPVSSYGQTPPNKKKPALRKVSSMGLSSSLSTMSLRRQSSSTLLLQGERGERWFTSITNRESSDGHNSPESTKRSGSSYSGIFGSGSWKGTGKWNFFGRTKKSSNEFERALCAEEKLRKVLNGSSTKGKAVDRRG